MDEENVTRRMAAQALGGSGRLAAVPLLRFKARTGDDDAGVTAECLTALMKLAPEESLPFVTQFLHAGKSEVKEGAAFALAESRRPEAFEILKDFWPRACGVELQEVVLLALSMLRTPAALDFLLALLSTERQSTALATLAALRIHRHNRAIKERVAAVVAQKGDAVVRARFEKKFDVEE
jgi:HEAT repeat protein